MKWRSYRADTGGVWYDVLCCSRRFSRHWWQEFWECAIIGNLSYYAAKWLGWKPWLRPKQRRLLASIEELEKRDAKE